MSINMLGGSQLPVALGGYNSEGGLWIPESNPKGFFMINVFIQTSGTIYPFMKNGVAYQVTAGLKFKVRSMLYNSNNSPNTPIGQFVTSTAAIAVGGAAAGTLTSPVWQNGAAAVYSFQTSSQCTWHRVGIIYEFSASTYPGFQAGVSGSSGEVLLFGKEEA